MKLKVVRDMRPLAMGVLMLIPFSLLAQQEPLPPEKATLAQDLTKLEGQQSNEPIASNIESYEDNEPIQESAQTELSSTSEIAQVWTEQGPELLSPEEENKARKIENAQRRFNLDQQFTKLQDYSISYLFIQRL